MTNLDAPFLELTADLAPQPLPPAVLRARSAMRSAVTDLAAITDADLPNPWNWSAAGKSDARYAFFRAYEILELAAGDAEAALAGAPARPAVLRLIGPTTASRWDLYGLLTGVTSIDWDADPGGGEWTIRRTMAHIIGGQRSFAWGTGWWLREARQQDDPALPPRVPAEFVAALPNEDTDDVAGSRTEAEARLDAILDLSIERLAALTDDRLDLGARYAGAPVSLGFRLGRWSSHMREHTIQVEKTLVMLGHRPTEVQRLVRLLLAAYGRLEAVVFGLPDTGGAAAIVGRAADEVRAVSGSAALSASVRKPG